MQGCGWTRRRRATAHRSLGLDQSQRQWLQCGHPCVIFLFKLRNAKKGCSANLQTLVGGADLGAASVSNPGAQDALHHAVERVGRPEAAHGERRLFKWGVHLVQKVACHFLQNHVNVLM